MFDKMLSKLHSQFARLRRQSRSSKTGARESNIRERYPDDEIGVGTYGDLTVHRYHSDEKLTIGSYCSFAAGVQVLMGGEHRPDFVSTFPFNYLWENFYHIAGHPLSRGPVRIGNDVWIGREAMIFSGVTIGDGAVVAARSLVTKNVEPYAVVGGQPAKVIRKRFPDPTINRLLAIRWWDWPRERIARSVPYLMSTDIDEFLSKAESGEL